MTSATCLGGQGRSSYARSVAAIVACCATLLCGCSGGGGDDGGVLLEITADGAGIIWQNDGTPPGLPFPCPTSVFLNAAITFTFSGRVSPSSVPATGVALGSINIVTVPGAMAAQGTFTLEDDPAFEVGNQRRVVFRPFPPANPALACGAGLLASVNYEITVPQGGNSPQVLVVAGEYIRNAAITCFDTCGCPSPGPCQVTFVDPVAGSPFVLATTPPTSDPPPSPIPACAIAGNTVEILVSEPLAPSGISLSSVRIVSVATGAQVPGTLVFHQAGSLPGLITTSRLDYVASQPLVANAIYEILFSPAVADFGGNPIQTTQSDPSARLFFQTMTIPTFPQAPIVETFDTTQGLSIVTGAIRWAGDGVLQATFPVELTGTGVDGPFNPPPAMTIILDTNEMVGGQSRQGIWNFTDVAIPATAIVRIVGPHLAHLRCTGSFTLDGTINANAGAMNPAVPGTPVFELGPEAGVANNGAPAVNCEARGGVANAGGGAGGTGSGVTPPPGSPPDFQCMLRANAGENGFGPTLNGLPNTGPANALYGGGQGGDSGCFPVVGAGCTIGDLGGLGGAGGTAGRLGEAGLPRQATAACAPVTGVVQPIAQPSAFPLAMVPPIAIQSAGSGGGGGGDHLDPLNVPLNDDQGGGGGGGGGGIRISCVGPYTQSIGGTILAAGALGAPAQTVGGAGGSGSGGEVWIQTFSTSTITASSIINVLGPPRLSPVVGNIGCSNQASGGGGAGLVQIEAAMGPPATPSFNLVPAPTPSSGAVFSAPPFAYATAVTGTAISNPIYAGPGVDFAGATEVVTLGNAPGATLSIRYEGAHEAINSSPVNPIYDPATTKSTAAGGGPITAANLDELDGYAFIWFVVVTSYAPPPVTQPNALLPSVDSITITFNLAAPCP